MNYTLQDILGVFTATALFPLLLLFPGYVFSHLLNVFEFRTRKIIVRLGIALIVSASTSPIIFFLAYRLVSGNFAILLSGGFAVLFIVQLIRTQGVFLWVTEIKKDRFARTGLYFALLWTLIATFFLIDIQIGQRLYYNIIAYDYTTRVSVIDAITRTGAPPINPSYFPGTPQPLTQVYYFWYLLCSIIDQIGGNLVTARTSLIASVIWAGLILCAAIALFIRLRSANQGHKTIWKNAFLAIGLLLVSGLDIFPSAFYLFFPRLLFRRIFEGDIEQWNEQITAWVGAVTWTPHHVISMVACILAWMLVMSKRNESGLRQIGVSLIIGLALASAFGLSVWLTFIFIVFWGIWFIIRLVQRESTGRLLLMIVPAVFTIITLYPFLLDLFHSSQGSATNGQFPLALNVRAFYPLEFITVYSPPLERAIVYLLALPLNYFIELGFFFMVGLIWLQNCFKQQRAGNPFALSETALFITTIILVTFMRSTIIANNDFGWRGWMFGQFILLIWGIDVLNVVREKDLYSSIKIIQKTITLQKANKLLSVLITVGIFTTFANVFFLRVWPMLIDTGIAGFPRILTPDNHLGARTLAARQAYDYIDQNLPSDNIVQFDPRFTMDRPAGLYRTRTAAISYHTLYGVPESVYQPLIQAIGNIFEESSADWNVLDSRCKQYYINTLILRDLDPIWAKLNHLKLDRAPLYENQYFAIFECGNVGTNQ